MSFVLVSLMYDHTLKTGGMQFMYGKYQSNLTKRLLVYR